MIPKEIIKGKSDRLQPLTAGVVTFSSNNNCFTNIIICAIEMTASSVTYSCDFLNSITFNIASRSRKSYRVATINLFRPKI